MEFLFSSMFLYEYDLDTISKAVKLSEYDGIEFWVETPFFWIDRDENKLENIKDSIKAIHSAVLDLNPVSVNDGVCELALKDTLYSINLCKKMNSNLITIHAGKRSAVREPVWADYISLKRYLRICERYSKLKGVKLCIENSEPKINYLCKTPSEMQEILEEFNIYLTLDLNHATKNSEDAEKFLEFIDRIENIHVSGYDSKGRHISSIGFEKIEFILTELSEIGYNKLITVELDDLGIGELGFEDKIKILNRELRFLRSIFRK